MRVVEARVDEPVAKRLTVLVVVALVVEALEVMKLEEFPKRVVIYVFAKFAVAAKKFVKTFRLVIEEVAANN